MEIVQSTTTTRQPEFVVALLQADITPYMLGALDAEKGEMACPELYFVKRGQMCEYCEGYESVAGPTLTTRQFLGGRVAATPADMEAAIDALFAPVAEEGTIDYDAELEDLIEGREDEAFWSRGMW